MSGLMSRGVVLTASRVSNLAILMLSPLLLVRILEVDQYGAYQEFMIYATLFITICDFGIDASLTYFLPRYPEKERQFLTQNTLLVLITSAAFLILFLSFREQFLKIASFDYAIPLTAYVFFFVNLNWLEYYWIAKRRTDLVLYYSAGRLAIRISTLLVVAYLTRDLLAILWSLVAVEALRSLLVAVFLLRSSLITASLDLGRTKEQLRFAGPVGLAKLMQQSSRNAGKLFIGSTLGPAALAYYAIASYLLPVVRVIRGSIAEVIFPELVRARDKPENAIRLWQRTNVLFCVLLFPLFVLLTWYGELFVTTLFTAEYLPAVPVFQVYIVWLLRRCFNADSLLRTRGKTGFMLTGTGVSVALNLALMVVLYEWLGMIGPAIAWVTAEILLEVYYLTLAKREFGIGIGTLIDWGGVCRVGMATVAAAPLLLLADLLPGSQLFWAVSASMVFVSLSWFIAHCLGVSDIVRLVRFVISWRGRSVRTG